MRLNERQVKTVSLAAGVSGKVVDRLSRELRIVYQSKYSEEDLLNGSSEPERFQIGVVIADPFLFSKLQSDSGLELFSETLREYANTCPVIVNWVGRGDFSDKKVPDRVNRGHLMHASRTAGRLKAELIRKLQFD